MNEGGGNRSQAKQRDAADQGYAAPEAVSGITSERAAHRHRTQSNGQNRSETGAGHVPVGHHGGNSETEDLNIEAIEDDRNRGDGSQEFLKSTPRSAIKQRADIHNIIQFDGRFQ